MTVATKLAQEGGGACGLVLVVLVMVPVLVVDCWLEVSDGRGPLHECSPVTGPCTDGRTG